MLDDPWRKAVAAVGYFNHRARLPSAALLGYSVILTKPAQRPLRLRVEVMLRSGRRDCVALAGERKPERR
jgi:hypothetical protein